MGGRGSGSGSGSGGGFGNAGGARAKIESLFPAELNFDVAKGNSPEKALERFKGKYGNANREYGVVLDKQGYALEHNKGGKHNVGFYTDVKDGTFIHNHPSGSHFSNTDLESFARSKIGTLVATSSNKDRRGDYKITKTQKFDPKGFVKAMNKASFDDSTMDSYNKGAHNWLKANQKKYGYKYTRA